MEEVKEYLKSIPNDYDNAGRKRVIFKTTKSDTQYKHRDPEVSPYTSRIEHVISPNPEHANHWELKIQLIRRDFSSCNPAKCIEKEFLNLMKKTEKELRAEGMNPRELDNLATSDDCETLRTYIEAMTQILELMEGMQR